jgi:hypothetical protein
MTNVWQRETLEARAARARAWQAGTVASKLPGKMVSNVVTKRKAVIKRYFGRKQFWYNFRQRAKLTFWRLTKPKLAIIRIKLPKAKEHR